MSHAFSSRAVGWALLMSALVWLALGLAIWRVR